MPPADETTFVSAGNVEDLEEDYVPESLADFVKKADQALNDDLKFLEDLSMSPRKPIDTTGSEISEGNKSDAIGDIEAELKKVSILDTGSRREGKGGVGSHQSSESENFPSAVDMRKTPLDLSRDESKPTVAPSKALDGEDRGYLHVASSTSRSPEESVSKKQTSKASSKDPSECERPAIHTKKLEIASKELKEEVQVGHPEISERLSADNPVTINDDVATHVWETQEDGSDAQSAEAIPSSQTTSAIKDITNSSGSDIISSNLNQNSPEIADLYEKIFTESPDKNAGHSVSLSDAMQDLNISDISNSSSPGKRAQGKKESRITSSSAQVWPKPTPNGKANATKKRQVSKLTPRSPSASALAVKKANGMVSATSNPHLLRKSRLFQPTVSSKAHTTRTSKPTATSIPRRFGAPRAPKTQLAIPRHFSQANKCFAQPDHTSRFMQPTMAATGHQLSSGPSDEATATAGKDHHSVAFSSRTSGSIQKQSQTTSRFMQPTAAAMAHRSSLSPSGQSASTRSSATKSQASGASAHRFMRPTEAAKAHQSASLSGQSSGTKMQEANASTNRFMQPTATANAHYSAASVSDQSYSTARKTVSVNSTSRFMQPTESGRRAMTSRKTKQTSDIAKNDVKIGAPSISSRLMKATASTIARQNVGVSLSALPQKRAVPADDAVARARDRARQRREQEHSAWKENNADFNIGTKSQQKAKPVKNVKSKVTKPKLTVPDTPKFATAARHGSKKIEAKKKSTDFSLAQSTDILAKTLRDGTSVPIRTARSGLTRPQSPKFHKTNKRPLPRSSVELEAEKSAQYKAQPLKASSNPNNLHTGSSAGLSKVSKRHLTKPKPFNLTTSSKSNVEGGFAVDLVSRNGSRSGMLKGASSEKPRRFKARPVPKTTFSPSIPVHQLASPSGDTTASRLQKDDKEQVVAKKQIVPREQTKVPREVKPFELESIRRHEARQKQLEMKHKQEQEEARKKAQFHAREYKALPSPQPIHSTKPPTTPQPFKLESLQRHEAFQELLNQKVAAEEEEFKKHLVPRARPLPETTYVYKPLSPSDKISTAPSCPSISASKGSLSPE